jgi:E1A/CREB-binding protein
MKEYGYCCGRKYVFLPFVMFCYGVNGTCCTIPRDGDYFVYNNPDSSRNNLSDDKYTFCKKCFNSVKSEYILVGDDTSQTLVKLPKAEFHQAKNDHQEQESMVDCIVCSRRFHNICVLYHEHIWSEGYVCKLCVQKYNIKRKDNRYLANNLSKTHLSDALENRVNTFIRKECDPDSGRVTIRVLAASDRVCEVKPRFKKHFGAQVPDGYPYRTKAIFAFQEIEGVDVVLFGMHVQEYDSRCPAPNSK